MSGNEKLHDTKGGEDYRSLHSSCGAESRMDARAEAGPGHNALKPTHFSGTGFTPEG